MNKLASIFVCWIIVFLMAAPNPCGASDAAPKAGVNNIAVTHKTNVADAFSKAFADIKEAEALIYKTSASGPVVLVARVQAGQWITLASS